MTVVIHTVRVLTINKSPNNCTLWYTIYDIHQLLLVSASRCHPQGVIITEVHKPTCQYMFCSFL